MACPNYKIELEGHMVKVVSTIDNYTIENGELNLNVGRKSP